MPKSWDLYFMGIAHQVGKHSRCLSRQIGAVLVRDKSIISTGYNGPPRGIPHCETRNPNREMICPRRLAGYQSGKGLYLCIADHAERNAIVNAARLGISTFGAILYADCGIPCKDCLIELINAGIIEIVFNAARVSQSPYYDQMSPWLIEKSDLLVRSVRFEEFRDA